MNELKEAKLINKIDDFLYNIDADWTGDGQSDGVIEKKEAKQILLQLVKRENTEARIDAIKSYKRVNKLLNETIVKDLLKCRDKDGFWIDKKLLKLITQLSSQLTNNKEGIEK